MPKIIKFWSKNRFPDEKTNCDFNIVNYLCRIDGWEPTHSRARQVHWRLRDVLPRIIFFWHNYYSDASIVLQIWTFRMRFWTFLNVFRLQNRWRRGRWCVMSLARRSWRETRRARWPMLLRPALRVLRLSYIFSWFCQHFDVRFTNLAIIFIQNR